MGAIWKTSFDTFVATQSPMGWQGCQLEKDVRKIHFEQRVRLMASAPAFDTSRIVFELWTLSRMAMRMPLWTGPVRMSTLSESMSFSVFRTPTGTAISSSSRTISILRPATVQFSRAKTSSIAWVMLFPSSA